MREEGAICNKKVAILSIIMIFFIFFMFTISNYSRGDPSEEFIVQDSNDNYHKVFVDDDLGKFEIIYVNDIDGDFPEDWSLPEKIFSSNNEISISELDIYLSPDIISIWWSETVQSDVIGYYTFSDDYGLSWEGPNNGEMFISLKYAKFDPLIGEPPIPGHLKVKESSESYEYYIVQHSAISPQLIHDDVQAIGGKFLGYTPYDAYLIWMNDSIKNEVVELPYIRWIGYYQPAYKIESGLSHEDGIIELIVSVFEEPDGQKNLQKVNKKIEEMDGQILYDGSSNYVIITRINAEKIDDLANIPEVAYIGGSGKMWPRELFPLHRINIIDDGPNSFNISETYNFTSVGWDDELETDLNRTWEPVWTVEGGVGKIIGDGYTVTFKGTNPGKGKIVCTDEQTGFTSSLDITVEGEVTEFPWIQVALFLFLVSLIIIAIIQFRKRTITSG